TWARYSESPGSKGERIREGQRERRARGKGSQTQILRSPEARSRKRVERKKTAAFAARSAVGFHSRVLPNRLMTRPRISRGRVFPSLPVGHQSKIGGGGFVGGRRTVDCRACGGTDVVDRRRKVRRDHLHETARIFGERLRPVERQHAGQRIAVDERHAEAVLQHRERGVGAATEIERGV